MAKYRVVKDFSDLQDVEGDKAYVYRENDKFPRKGRAKKERIEELSTKNNKRGEVLIEEVTEDDSKEEDDA